ncbi:hypothetical protein ACNHUS_05210 [Actinomycetes bacterium M1A6_2h]
MKVVAGVVLVVFVQTLLVVGDPVPTLSWAFVARAVASFVSVVLAFWIGFGGGRRVLGWTAALAALAVVAAVANPFLPVLVAVAGLLVLPVVADGAAVTSVGRTITGAPLRFVVALLVFVLAVAVTWAVALVLGLFVTGPIAAGLTWLWFGLVATAVVAQWSSLRRHASPTVERPLRDVLTSGEG